MNKQGSKTNGKKENESSVIDHTNIINTISGAKLFLKEYTNLPLSCKVKIDRLVTLFNSNDPSFRIKNYTREADKGYHYYELIKYSVRDGVKPIREHIPAIDLVTKLINLYYNSNTKLNLNIEKLIIHCEGKTTKRAPRKQKTVAEHKPEDTTK